MSGNADWRARLTRLQLDIGQHWIVRRVLAVMDVTNRAGGPLLAAALAFGTMFAVIPTVLLLSGVLGWIVDDPQLRNELLVELIGAFPPLADVFEDSLEAVVDARGALTIVGLVGLLWGASNFYANLEAVMVRIFEGGTASATACQAMTPSTVAWTKAKKPLKPMVAMTRPTSTTTVKKPRTRWRIMSRGSPPSKMRTITASRLA